MVRPAEREAGEERAAEQLRGTVERVVYHDERTRYTVLRVAVPGMSELVTVVGRTSAPEVGAEADIVGSWANHPTHGRQFAFDRIKVALPTTLAGIERRLTRYPGVKDVMAARIVARFGLDTLEILEKQPNRLTEVEGIGPRTRDKIVEYHRDQVGPVAELEAHLVELDIPVHFAKPLFDRYAEDALSVVRTQPYRLAREVRGIGFLTADRMARSLGLAPDSPERIDAGMMHTLEQAENDGHCGLPIEQLVRKAGAALGVEHELVRESGERLVQQGDLVLEYGSDGTPLCFAARFVAAERAVADALVALAKG
ncbi:MAG TPA: helix-hairpin-helix domain-containing protein, partial [Nannocystaceae bacterium]|nr:helix-hairpin-helix domain-containing protein [Nannocystaceae bacterium]